EGVTGKLVSDSAQAAGHRNVLFIQKREKLVKTIDSIAREGDMLITFGAGDINKLGPELLTVFRKHKIS
ncbi:UDP-N-acetylmuramate--L-alanine ligase, partial [Candidatus Latescibacterota bacterium]